MIIQLCKSDRIENWQEYLQGQVADHPAWRSFPQIRTQEIDPSKPICVGYWEGGNSLPNANELIGSGTIADLLKLVDNPKSNTMLSQPGGNKGRRPNESIRIGYTVHIRNIGDESEDDTNENLDSSPPPQKERPVRRKQHSKAPKLEESEIEEEVISSEMDSDSQDESLSLVKQEKNTSTLLVLPTSSSTQTLRPSTPSHSALGRKRSLTILSPERISTWTTRELKKSRSATALAKASIPADDNLAHNITPDVDTGEITDNDFELGFQFLN